MTQKEQAHAMEIIFKSLDAGYTCEICDIDCDSLNCCPLVQLYQEITRKTPPISWN